MSNNIYFSTKFIVFLSEITNIDIFTWNGSYKQILFYLDLKN